MGYNDLPLIMQLIEGGKRFRLIRDILTANYFCNLFFFLEGKKLLNFFLGKLLI